MKILRILSIVIFALLAITAYGCSTSIIETAPTEINTKSFPPPTFTETETQEPFDPSTPTYSQTIRATASLRPEDTIVPSPGPEEQMYIDPEGWYSVIFSVDFEPTVQVNRFSKDSSVIEFGFLSDLGHVSGTNNVCAWLANIVEEDPENWILDWSLNSENCSIRTIEDVPHQVKYDVYYHPSADPSHRFAYIKSAWYDCPIRTTFSWLKPVSQKYVQKLSPIDIDLLTEWESIAPILDNVTVNEYPLPTGSNPYREMLVSSLPEEAKPYWARGTSTPSVLNGNEEPPAESILESLGYELKYVEGDLSRGQLFRDGRILFEPVWKTFLYKFDTDSGTLYAIEVISQYGSDEAYLILNDVIHQWSYSHQDPGFPPILYQDKLLWIQASEDWNHVQAIDSNRDVIFSFAIHTEPMLSTRKFIEWDGHWVLALRDFVIIDGEILNQTLGFQEIFNWRLIDGKPAYFFQKDGRAGFSFDGKIYPLEYQNIAHYLCCGYAVNNPSIEDNSARFFAEREGVWYYVVLKFR